VRRAQVLLKLSRDALLLRLQARAAQSAHFMPATLLDSQLATLQPGGANMLVVQGMRLACFCKKVPPYVRLSRPRDSVDPW
jgi:gluconate kinase